MDIVVELALDSAVVNLFLIGWSRPRPVDVVEARQAVAGLVHELPFFDERSLRAWRAPSGQLVLACAGHRPGETSGVVYEHLDPDHVALFSGRPFIWTEEFKADGRTPLDARFFLGNPDEWSELLDGRCVAVRYDDTTSTLDVYTDPLGSYHLYVTERDGQSWLSNNSELLRRLTSTRTINPLVLASLVGCGWSFGGQPPWDGIRRLPPGGHRFRPGAADARRELLPAKSIGGFLDRGLDSQAAARTLVAAVRALADWPGRPKYLSLTGGRDSRLVFAAALRDGIEFEPRIIAGSEEEPETEDIRVARLVAESVGCTLRVAFSHPVATLDDAARILRLAAPGALQLDFAWAALNRPDQQWWLERSRERLPLPLVLTGQGGEIARRWYDIGSPQSPAEAVRRLTRRVTLVWPRPILSRQGKQLLHAYVDEWVRTQLDAGTALVQVSELFHLLERTANWAGASHAFDEYMTDLASPLLSRRLLPYELGLPAGDRARELFHFHVLEALSPELTRMRFSGSAPDWPMFGRNTPSRARKLRTATDRVGRELARRYQHMAHRSPAKLGERMLADAARGALDRALGRPRSDDVWRILDRRRTVRLLGRDPRALDVRSRRNAWRLVTVFLSCID